MADETPVAAAAEQPEPTLAADKESENVTSTNNEATGEHHPVAMSQDLPQCRCNRLFLVRVGVPLCDTHPLIHYSTNRECDCAR